MSPIDDLVGVRVIQRGGVTNLVVQRRAEAETTIHELASGSGRLILRDVVGNPVLVDAADVVTACFLAVTVGAPLADGLAPVPSALDLQALVPEINVRPRAAERRSSAADEDPIERTIASWGQRH